MGEKHKWTPEEVQFWYRGRKSQNYCNPEDTNWVVRKPRSLGWTMNLANKKTWWFLAGVACAMLLIVTVQKNWNRSIGIIGGADGPTVIYVSDKRNRKHPPATRPTASNGPRSCMTGQSIYMAAAALTVLCHRDVSKWEAFRPWTMPMRPQKTSPEAG